MTRRPAFAREQAQMGVALAIGLGTSGVLGFLVLFVPGSIEASPWGIAGVSLIALGAGAGVYVARDRVSLWACHVGVIAGILMITGAIAFQGDRTGNIEILYLYVAGFVCYFFSPLEAALYVLGCLVAFALAETTFDVPVEPTDLIVVLGGMVMTGVWAYVVGSRSRTIAADLETEATTDALTGLFNRRGLQRLADAEMARALRKGQPFSLLIGDLDHFKAVNDKLGHMGGDMALERVAHGFNAERRGMDSVARIGGEEFAVLMPETDKKNAVIAAERFRESIRSTFRGRPVELTMSLGVATFPRDGESWEQLLDAADSALYEAKDAGRDQVVAF